MSDLILALDVGGSKITAGILGTQEVAWRAHRRIKSPAQHDARYDIEMILALGRDLLNGEAPTAIGVSFGGPVDAATGLVRLSHHVAGWQDTPLRELLEKEFNAPASVDNDANAGALGELRFGAGRGAASLLYITVSTGVGGGWVLNRQIWRGADSMAGEFGHMVVEPDGPLCLCGKHGCVERLASGPNLAQRARERLLENPARGSVLLRLSGNRPETITAITVASAAEEGDELACELLEKSAWALGVGIGNAANLVNPELFILGGGVTKSGPRFWHALAETAHSTALPKIRVQILPAELGDDAPLWGAAALALDLLRFKWAEALL